MAETVSCRYRDTSLAVCDYTPLGQRDLNDSEEELFPCNSGSVSVRYSVTPDQQQKTFCVLVVFLMEFHISHLSFDVLNLCELLTCPHQLIYKHNDHNLTQQS